MPAWPTRETRCARPSRPVAWNCSFRNRSSSARPTNGGSRTSPRPAAAIGDDPKRPARCDGDRLALERGLAQATRTRSPPPPHARGVADENGSRIRDGLEPARGVHEIAGDESLAHGADGYRGFAGQDAGPDLQVGAEGAPQRRDGVDELQRRPDRSLRVVLMGDRSAPNGHDRVPDELLERAAVAPDDIARRVEVTAQQLARLLGVAFPGERGEADEVGEQDRHEPALRCPPDAARAGSAVGGCGSGRCANESGVVSRALRRGGSRPPRSAGSARPVVARGVAHSEQNFALGGFAVPHVGQVKTRRVAHSLQNLAPGGFSLAAVRADHPVVQ